MNPYRQQSWTPRSVWSRMWAVLVEEGPRNLWFKALGESVYRRLVVAEMSLTEAVPASAASPHALSALHTHSLADYLRYRTDLTEQAVAERLEKGDECWVLLIEGRVAQACWIASGASARISYLECDVELHARGIYVYEFYVHPEFRGRGLSLAALEQVVAEYRARGYERLIWAWIPENAGAAGLVARAGMRPLGLLGYWRLGRWRKYFLRGAGANRIPGLMQNGLMRWHRHPGAGSVRAETATPSWYLDPLAAAQKRAVHQQWIRAAVRGRKCETVLKTDLFEDAYGDDRIFHDLFPAMRRAIGIDVHAATVSAAVRRGGGTFTGMVCDVRRLALPDASVDVVVSTSTLDHFEDQAEIAVSLDELSRVVRPGGMAIVTLDNPRNPFYLLLKFLTRRGWTPFSLGATLSLAELEGLLAARGFVVEQRGFLIHNPRLLSTLLLLGLRRCLGRCADRPVGWFLSAFALLGELPTRSFTGCFLAVSAVKQAELAGPRRASRTREKPPSDSTAE